MDRDEVWQAIDTERLGVADLLDDLFEHEWETASLCAGWRVRDVAAHLTLAHMRLLSLPAIAAMLRARGDVHRLIHDTALRQARLPVQRYAELLRGMVGSRRKVLNVSHLEPLIDILVHGQDIAIPLGRSRVMPPAVAATGATRVWSAQRRFFRTERTLDGLRIVATDHPWAVGDGVRVDGPIAAILLVLTGRPAALPQLSGPGAALLEERFATLGAA